jgi:hypothetical protein
MARQNDIRNKIGKLQHEVQNFPRVEDALNNLRGGGEGNEDYPNPNQILTKEPIV